MSSTGDLPQLTPAACVRAALRTVEHALAVRFDGPADPAEIGEPWAPGVQMYVARSVAAPAPAAALPMHTLLDYFRVSVRAGGHDARPAAGPPLGVLMVQTPPQGHFCHLMFRTNRVLGDGSRQIPRCAMILPVGQAGR
jgi:hypothetical protein